VAVAEIIGSAVGAMLLIVVAYLLIGNVLSTAEIVSSAQKDLTLSAEMRLQTDIQIVSAVPVGSTINLTIKNTGNQIITDFPHMNVFVYTTSTPGYQIFNYSTSGTATWSWTGSIIDDYVHPGELDPGETMYVNAYFPDSAPNNFDVGICTNNGVYASTIV